MSGVVLTAVGSARRAGRAAFSSPAWSLGFAALVAGRDRRGMGDGAHRRSHATGSTTPTKSKSRSARLQALIEQTETARRGYLLTGNPPISTTSVDRRARSTRALDQLGAADRATIRASAAGSPNCAQRIAAIRERQDATIALVAGRQARRRGRPASPPRPAPAACASIRDLFARWRADERAVARDARRGAAETASAPST